MVRSACSCRRLRSADQNRVRAARRCRPRSGSSRWKSIFWKSRSVASAMRAQSDDHQGACTAGEAAGAVTRYFTVERVLPADANVRERSGIDARHRRTASGIPLSRRAAVAQDPRTRRPPSRRSPAHWHAHAEDGHYGAVPQTQYQQAASGAQGVPVPAAPPRYRAGQPRLAMDITYLPMQRGFIYLAAVMDWATRRVPAWSGLETPTTRVCVT